jgi:alpha/beta hydrolase fold
MNGTMPCWFRMLGWCAICLFLNSCQSRTETYGGERPVVAPTKAQTQKMEEGAAKDTAAADSQMKAVLDELTALSPKPIETRSADDAREQPTPADAVMKLLKKQGKSRDPQPVGDVAMCSYVWTLDHAREIKGDSSMVAVAGESAGGNLAAAVSMMAHDHGKPLSVQLLIYPVAGYDFNTPSYQKNAHAKPLNKALMPWFFEKYLRSPADADHPHISLTKAAHLQGLAPATIVTAEIDPLQSEGQQ